MSHLGDTNKMISDTPRTETYVLNPLPQVVSAEWARQLERELNAANAEIERLTAKVAQLYEGAEEQKQRIKRLEEMYEGVIGEKPELLGSNVMGLLKRELNFAQKRIKRLEEAGDRMRLYCADPDDCFAWDRAKETKL